MENKILLNENKQIIINENGKILTTKTNYNSSVVKITHAELVALRNESKLIPGQQYRITDYETTTSQEDTRSAGHRFDIIVVADDENTLNENARACVHEGETYFGGQTINEIIYKGTFKEGITYSDINVAYTISIDQDGLYEGLKDGVDQIVEIGYSNGTPIFYKNGVDYIESGEEGTDYNDVFKYNGQVEYEGETYDCWKKFEDGEEVGIIVYTNIVVENAEAIETKKVLPQIANLSAWELKYCLDNDSKFDWASDYSIYVDELDMEFYYVDNQTINGTEYSVWVNTLFFDTRLNDTVLLANPIISNIKAGDSLAIKIHNRHEGTDEITEDFDIVREVKRGKGVIYYMKDEWNNECSYDFKNIQFLRRAKDFDEEITLFSSSAYFPQKKYDLYQKLNDNEKSSLRYGLETPVFPGEDIIDNYFDGDYQGYTEYLNKHYICLDDPEYYDETYYLIRVLEDEYIWCYTFCNDIYQNNIKDNSLTDKCRENKILYDPINSMLPNNIISGSSFNISLIDCYDNSFLRSIQGVIVERSHQNTSTASISKSRIFDSKHNVCIGSYDYDMYLDNFNRNIIRNGIEGISGYKVDDNVFESITNLKLSNGCYRNDFKNIKNCNVGIELKDSYIEGKNNVIGNINENITLVGNFNKIGDGNDTIEIYGSKNVIKNNCRYIYFQDAGNEYNIIGNNCSSIGTMLNRLYILKYCIIGDSCDSIYFREGKYTSCVFGEKCHAIEIKASGVQLSSNIIQKVNVAPFCNHNSSSKVIEIEPELEYVTVIKDASAVEMIINEGE